MYYRIRFYSYSSEPDRYCNGYSEGLGDRGCPDRLKSMTNVGNIGGVTVSVLASSVVDLVWLFEIRTSVELQLACSSRVW
jgi:hypothetical protein